MDGTRFDLWTRRRLGLLAGGSLAVLFGLTGRDAAARKRKRRKKKRKSKTVCRRIRDDCSAAPGEDCCGDLICNDNSCVGDPICVRDEGGSCRDICDCRLGLQCSERTEKCQQCTLLQNPCQDHDDCCLRSAACGTTSVGPGVCCQQLGGACGFDSDCCADTASCAFTTAIGCASDVAVCCRRQGFPCSTSCDCCDPRRCVSGTCQ
jgi:hypothetical protein